MFRLCQWKEEQALYAWKVKWHTCIYLYNVMNMGLVGDGRAMEKSVQYRNALYVDEHGDSLALSTSM